jgi:DNA-binding CsgD family transcriptional regulator
VDRALAIAERTGDQKLSLRTRRFEIVIGYGERGDPEAAARGVQANMAAARALGFGFPQGLAAWQLLYIPAPSRREADDAALVSRRTDAWSWDVALQQATLFLHRGDLAEAQRLLSGPSAASDASSCGLIGAEWSAALGWFAWEQGRFEEAAGQLARAGSEQVMRTYNTISWGPAFLPLRVDALVRLGQADAAASAVAAAEACNLSHGRFMAAALAAARFRLAPSQDRALPAEAAALSARWPWLHALTCCWRGEFLGDISAAYAGRKEFESLGAQLGVARTEVVLRGLGARQFTREPHVSALTPRELEVSELVAEGLTNPAIARRLYLSRPTVASHVAHILAKLDFSSRAQIAAWVTQRRVQAPQSAEPPR